jgi:hypothetical protein
LFVLAMSLEKFWAIGWRFLVVGGVIFIFASWVKIPPMVCRVPVVGQVAIEIVDIMDQIEKVDCLSSRALFFGPRNEVLPESLQLPEWDGMQYMEPNFIIP